VLGAPHHVSDAHAGAFVEGSVLARLRLHAVQVQDDDDDERDGVAELIVSAHHDVAGPVETGRIVGESVNLARDLQNRPPTTSRRPRSAERAREIAANHDTLTLEVMGRSRSRRPAWARSRRRAGHRGGAAADHLRYDGPGRDRPGARLRRQGRDVRLRRHLAQAGNKMSDMKFDMSGGAACWAPPRDRAPDLPVELIAVIGATENLPSGNSMKPGDILRARNGTTIEIINTDAEGRLVLADCLTTRSSRAPSGSSTSPR
jgi:leucyl aminopeptidase